MARANTGEAYGFGSRNAALGGATAAAGSPGYAAYTNPAALAASSHRLHFAWSLLVMQPSFLPLENLVLENNWVSDKSQPVRGNVDTDYRATIGQAFGLAYQIPGPSRLSFGLTAYFPLNQLAYLDSTEAFIPEYVLYRARTQRPQLELGAGLQLSPGLYVGAGAHFGFSITTNATVFLQTDQARPSTLRISGSVKPKVSPYFGLLVQPPSEAGDVPTRWSAGLVVRLPQETSYDAVVNSGTGVFTGFPALDFKFSSMSTLVYDPMTIEGAVSWRYTEASRLHLQLDHQAWSRFKTPTLTIQNPTGISFSTWGHPSYDTQDIWIPRVGHEIDFRSWIFRAGYAYRPSIFPGLPTEAGNYLDPPKHMIQVGTGFRFQSFLGLPAANELDLHFAYHQLVQQRIDKSPGNEGGVQSDLKIGAPGYDAGGKVIGGGLSLSFAF